MKHGLVIAANRLHIHRVEGQGRAAWQVSPGGLVTAMAPILARRGGHWIGWNGTTSPASGDMAVSGLSISPIGLNRTQVADFVRGF